MSAGQIATGNWQLATGNLDVGGLRWEVTAEYRELLLGTDGLRLEEWLQAGQAKAVKHGPLRTVYHVTLPGLSFYVKRCRLAGTRAWLREIIRPPKARIEYQKARAVAERGVPTITPLAVGHSSGAPGDSFLVTRALEDTEPLNTFLEGTLPTLDSFRRTRVRQRIAVVLGEFLARMHDAGIRHDDLHPGNLLIQLDGDDQPHLYLIDLHAVRLGRPLGWRESRHNLVILNRWFVLRASRTDRLRCWHAYAETRNSSPPTTHCPLASDLEHRTWNSNLRFWRSRDRRCLATNKYYYRFRSGSVVGHAVRDLDRAVLEPLLADPDEPFRRAGVTVLKDSRSSTVAEFDLLVAGVPRRVIYKRFHVTDWSDPLKSLLRPTGALRSWVFGQGLRERGLPTPRPLAVLHRRRTGLLREGYLLTEKVPDAVDLHRFVADLATLSPAERHQRLRQTIDDIARLVRELHRRQLSHRDLKAANILICSTDRRAAGFIPAGMNPAARLMCLIDLVGVTRCHKLGRSRRVQNLARLHASFWNNSSITRTDCLRFLRVYLQWGLIGRGGWKRWWRDIELATAVKIARNSRNGRPLA